MRKLLSAAKVSQMDNPQAGTGTGGDRCTEAVAAMIDCTYQLGPSAKAAQTDADREAIMYQLTEMLNGGSNVSSLENFGVWFPAWLANNGYDKVISLANVHNPGWQNIIDDIDRQHCAVVGVNDYSQLRLVGGGNPYQWPENEHAGHVMLLVGYDTDSQAVILHDPLRGLSGMPADYSFASLQAAGFSDLTEIVGSALPLTTGGTSTLIGLNNSDVAGFFTASGDGWQANGHIVRGEILASYQNWPAQGADNGLTALGLPLGNEIQVPGAPAGVVYQTFERGVLVYDPSRAYDNPPGSSGPVYLAHFALAVPPAAPPTDTSALQQQLADAQQRLTQATTALEDAQQQLKLLTEQEPSDPVALQQRQTSALETVARAVVLLVPPSERAKLTS